MTLISLKDRCTQCIEYTHKKDINGFADGEDCFFSLSRVVTIYLTTGQIVSGLKPSSCFPDHCKSFDDLDIEFECIVPNSNYKKYFTCNAKDVVAVEMQYTI